MAGLEQAQCDYVHLTNDDIEVTNSNWAKACIEATDKGNLPCPIVRKPDGSIESCGGTGKNGLLTDIQPDGTEVEWTVLPFMNKEQANAIGMIPAHHATDVWVSRRGKELGWPTVLVHGYEVIHHYSNIGRIDSPAQRKKDRAIFREAMECVS
jgi:hypothetical protein